MAKMFGCSHPTPPKRGDQIPTRRATLAWVMSQPEFARGVHDKRDGLPYPADIDAWAGTDPAWNYERGRQWATLAPRHVPLKVNGKLNPAAFRYGGDIL